MSDLKQLALIGNPNCGKTTLFNILTGANQKVGNWPGVTVEKKSGQFHLADQTYSLVDLPGIYSLEQASQSVDEKIAQDFLLENNIDLIINIVDATNLERSLVLTQQLLERNVPVLVVVNMLDVAEQQGISINLHSLETKLDTPVIPVIASRKKGLEKVYHHLEQELSKASTSSANTAGDVGDNAGTHLDDSEEQLLQRYHRSQQLIDGVVEVIPTAHSLSERLDSILINRWLGFPVFLAAIYLMFTIAVNLGAVFIDFFDILFAAVLVDGTGWLLEQVSALLW